MILSILFLGGITGNNASINVPIINIVISTLYDALYVIGEIILDTPIISNILNIFEPKIFPIAISLLPLAAAVTLVTSSGRLVPGR